MKLHPYQERAVSHLREHSSAALFLDMGLGKTASVLSALQPADLPALVVAPKRVAENVWHVEAAKWRPDLFISVASGTANNRARSLTSGADIVVLGRDNLADIVDCPVQFRTLILDELSGFKSRSTTRFKVARSYIKHHSPRVWGLTGTPAPNGLLDLWSQVYLLDGGQRLGKTITSYRDRYFYPGRQLSNGVITEWILKTGADEKIHAAVADICLSIDPRGLIDLPPVTYNTVEVPLLPAVRKIYKELRNTMVANLELLGGELHTAGNAAILSSKLSQVTAGFLYVDGAEFRDGAYSFIHNEKIKALEEIVEGTGGSPILVFYRYKAERDAILAAFPKLAHFIDEKDSVERWNNGEIPMLVAHPASAGHGLNLQHGGHTVVWTSLPWSLEEWEQGNKRVARQGQKHAVVIHSIVSPDTIDEAVKFRLTEKASVQSALLRYLESTGAELNLVP